jgi:hypothetical protein
MHWRIKVRAKMILSLRMIFNQGTSFLKIRCFKMFFKEPPLFLMPKNQNDLRGGVRGTLVP